MVLLRWLVGSPKGAPLDGGDKWLRRTRDGAGQGSKRKSSSKLLNLPIGRTNYFQALDR